LFLIGVLLFFIALRGTGVAMAMFLLYTAPVYVALLAPRLLREPSDRTIYLALAVALAGMAVVVLPDLLGHGAAASTMGIAAGAAAGAAFGLFTIVVKTLTPRVATLCCCSMRRRLTFCSAPARRQVGVGTSSRAGIWPWLGPRSVLHGVPTRLVRGVRRIPCSTPRSPATFLRSRSLRALPSARSRRPGPCRRRPHHHRWSAGQCAADLEEILLT
jgi:hypothetical protein